MKNSPYLDKPYVPLAVALRSMLGDTEAKLANVVPAERARLRERAEVLRESIKPKSTIPYSTYALGRSDDLGSAQPRGESITNTRSMET